jgi:hypothetical protein
MLPRLGLALEHVGAAWLCAAASMLVYALTCADDLTFYDSPELALVAHQLGLGHPIGQPLHTWLGALASHVPGVPPLLGLTLMSALFASLAILPAWSIAERLAGDRPRSLPIAIALALSALHPIAWEPSTRVEVYTLAVFFALWAVARALATEGSRWPVGLSLGLAASANPVIAAAFAAALTPRLVSLARRATARARAAFVLALVAGVLPYLHVFLVARDRERFVWGAPENLTNLRAYLTGADYAHNAGIDAATFVEHLGALTSQGLEEASLPIALLGLAAHLLLGRRHAGSRWIGLVAGGLCVAFVARNVVFHVDVPDYRGYLHGPWLLASSGVAALTSVLAARGRRFVAYAALVTALPLAALLLRPAHLLGRRDHPALGRALVRGALSEAPRDAILLVEADHWVASLLYAQEVERARPDVVVLAFGLGSSQWYWEHLYARHPSLAVIALRGPGGRAGRVRRFLDANPSRPLLAEDVRLAELAGRSACGVGWLVWAAPACAESARSETTRVASTPRFAMVDPADATRAITRAWTEAGEAREVAARVGLARGEALFRLGRTADAFDAFLAHEPRPRPPGLPREGPPLRAALPPWRRPAALHDPARNLFMSSWVLERVGLRADASGLLDEAAASGLPEALELRAALAGGR